MIKSVVLFLVNLPTKWFNAIALSYRRVQTGHNVRINGKIRLYGRGSIVLEDNVRINSCRRANPIGGDISTVLNTCSSGKIVIGAGSGISNSAIVSRESVSIGKNVRVGGGCQIFDNDFHSLNCEKRISAHDDDIQTKPVVIKDGAFLGARCLVLKGVTIGENSVIGAGSVVTKDVPDNEIWGGNPARFIKKLEK